MATRSEPEIVLYDLACTKNVCFSPVVWRIRLMLNYKRIPYKTIFLEFPDIAPILEKLGTPLNQPAKKYTVPAIHHLPSNTYIMDSLPIATFLETTYPSPPLPLTSELGAQIETQGRAEVGKAFFTSIMPREMAILSPHAQEYYRRTREALIGHPLEDLLVPGKEEAVWRAAEVAVKKNSEMMGTHKGEDPFVLGKEPSYTDFFIAGNLQSARVVHEPFFEKLVAFEGYGAVLWGL